MKVNIIIFFCLFFSFVSCKKEVIPSKINMTVEKITYPASEYLNFLLKGEYEKYKSEDPFNLKVEVSAEADSLPSFTKIIFLNQNDFHSDGNKKVYSGQFSFDSKIDSVNYSEYDISIFYQSIVYH